MNARVEVRVDGHVLQVAEGTSVAHALLRAGITTFRPAADDETPRSVFCGMGSCYACLVGVDGERVRACLTPVAEGMTITTGASSA